MSPIRMYLTAIQCMAVYCSFFIDIKPCFIPVYCVLLEPSLFFPFYDAASFYAVYAGFEHFNRPASGSQLLGFNFNFNLQ